MKRVTSKIFQLTGIIFLVFSYFPPFLVLAETVDESEPIYLQKLQVTERKADKLAGKISLRLSNEQETTMEQLITFDEGVQIKKAVYTVKEGEQAKIQVATNQDPPAPIGPEKAEKTNAGDADEKASEPLKDNQMCISIPGKTELTGDIAFEVIAPKTLRQLTGQWKNQKVTATIPQDSEGSSSTTSSSEGTDFIDTNAGD